MSLVSHMMACTVVSLALTGAGISQQRELREPTAASVEVPAQVHTGEVLPFRLRFNKEPHGYEGGKVICTFEDPEYQKQATEYESKVAEWHKKWDKLRETRPPFPQFNWSGGRVEASAETPLADGITEYTLKLPILRYMEGRDWRLKSITLGHFQQLSVEVQQHSVFHVQPNPIVGIQVEGPESIKAGQSASFKVTVDGPDKYPELCKMRLEGVLQGYDSFERDVSAGRQTYEFVLKRFPNDTPRGTWKLHIQLDSDECGIMGRADRDLAVFGASDLVKPDSASLAWSLTQKQFLDTQAAGIQQIQSELYSGLEHERADTKAQRRFLATIVEKAQKALLETEQEYKKRILKPGQELPAFFADFEAQYSALHIELMASTESLERPHLVLAQLKTREPQPQKPPVTLSNTLSPDALAVWHVLMDNMKAYLYVKDSERVTFDGTISSIPSGARIFYKRAIDTGDYKDYPTPTDVNVTLELATWMFKFHREGCAEDQFQRVDPYDDPRPNIRVEFTKCRSR